MHTPPTTTTAAPSTAINARTTQYDVIGEGRIVHQFSLSFFPFFPLRFFRANFQDQSLRAAATTTTTAAYAARCSAATCAAKRNFYLVSSSQQQRFIATALFSRVSDFSRHFRCFAVIFASTDHAAFVLTANSSGRL